MLENGDMSSEVRDVVGALEPATLPPTNGFSKPPSSKANAKEPNGLSNGVSNGLRVPEDRPELRRHSSALASLEDLHLGPSVVVPPEHMHKPSDAHETAAAMEMAKRRLDKFSLHGGALSTPPTPAVTSTTDRFAFAFDIDGVLIRGGKVIPQAVEAMKILNGQNDYGIKV